MREYEAVLPGSADRLLTLAESRQRHRTRIQRMSQCFGIILAIALIAVSAYFISLGFVWEAAVIIICGMAGAAAMFIYRPK